ncbi:MAG: peptidylprolyl isomerase [Bacteroidota bacterium]|nr:peptidylprolyl isomerase [Bacteroidota bacterium]MDX5427766.1 peptidylprolyl isomerase [Bacteroidota bacterium]MDX5448434.1 peptidylprolyl isomerase [Bacteroidota bacterium]MDX5505649.1 peptidylprolyl isomerase [Bacteroidota bacterium]
MTRRILRSISWIFILIPVMGMAQPQLVDGVVAVVGNKIILKSDVEGQYESLQRQAGPNAQGMTECRVFEDLLFEKLLLHHAALDSVTISDEEVDGNIDRRLQMLIAQIGSKEKLEEYYKKSIVEIKEEMRPLMKNQLVAQRMQGTITQDLEITPSEVREFYADIPSDSLPLVNTEVELGQIVKYPEVKMEAKEAAIQQLKDLKERIENGTSFSTMAILYSEDPGSAKNGGVYNNIKRGQFVKEFEAVAFNLRRGQISDPFETEYGYHIVQLIERRGEELDVAHILIKPKITDADLEEAEAFLDSLRRMIMDGKMTFEEAAEKYSEDDGTKYNGGILMNNNTGDTKYEINMLDKTMFLMIEKLEPGQISRPGFFRVNGNKEAFRIIKLINKIDPHKANLRDDYTRIKQFALSRKQAEAMEEWINNRSKDTYIKINTLYYQCDFEYDWLNENP